MSLTSAELARILAAEVAVMKPGDRLPGEHTLMRAHGVSRATVRNAIDDLVARHLVRRAQGSGTYAYRRVDYLVSHAQAPSLHETVKAAGGSARTFVRSVSRMESPDFVVEHFAGVESQGFTRIVRMAYIDGILSSYAEEWIPDGVADEIEASLQAVESLYHILRMRGWEPKRVWTRATTDVSGESDESLLDVDRPTPIWLIDSLSSDEQTGKPLLFSSTKIRQDLVRLVFELG